MAATATRPQETSILTAKNTREFIVNAVLIVGVSLPRALIGGLLLGLIPASVIGGIASLAGLADFWSVAGIVMAVSCTGLFAWLVYAATYPAADSLEGWKQKPAPRPD
jgi:hypothetical protein